MIVIKVLFFVLILVGWHWMLEEEYVEHVQNSLAQAATAADEAVIPRTKPIDVEQTHDLSVLVGIGREILMLLKCILALVFSGSWDYLHYSETFIN